AREPTSGAGATWPAAATAPRRPATAPGLERAGRPRRLPRSTPSRRSRLSSDQLDQPAGGVDHPVRPATTEELRDTRPGKDEALELGLIDPHGNGDAI